MKLLEHFRFWDKDKEKRENFFKCLKEKYSAYFANSSTATMEYHQELQWQILKMQEDIEELKKQ